MNSRQAYIVLNMMEGVGPVTVRLLSAALGSVEAILSSTQRQLLAVEGVGADKVAKIVAQRSALEADSEEAKANAFGARLVTPADTDYPRRLLEIHDPPLALYVQGTLEGRDGSGVALVGSRRTTHYGLETAERLALQLAGNGITVVSGLARGIDTAAHRGALKAGGRTVAVLGGGLDCLFPPENAGLARQIMQQGCVLSEYPMGRQPDKTTFPVRNRIVSALSLGVVVVECDVASGAMITARQAMEQGRTVFAVPGRIDSLGSRGPHRLIRDGACLVRDTSDILDELGALLPVAVGKAAHEPLRAPGLSKVEADVVEMIREDGESDVDGLVRRSGRKAAEIGAILLGLEMKRVVKMLPGQRVGLRQS